MRRQSYLLVAAGLLAVAVACGEKSPSPVSPSATTPATDAAGDAAVGPDGETMKTPAPSHVSPANGVELENFDLVLRVNPVTAKFTDETRFAYRFQILRDGQPVGDHRTSNSTEWEVNLSSLEVDTTYSWRARAERGIAFGPWSEPWTFTTPEIPQGYNVPGELYDPLYTGRTVGTVNGPVTFIPGEGVRMEDFVSNIEYVLPQNIPDGEFSMLVKTWTNTEGNKTKVMSMREGRSDITTNDRRFTIEKRGNPAGIIAFRIITRFSQEETVGQERVRREFDRNRFYLWRASFRGGRFQLEIFQDGPNGNRIYSFGKNYVPPYDPNPHLAYVGAPVGRGGPLDATVPGMIVKQVWLSNRPRPPFANN
jgi:hypothetical protein